MAAGGHHLMRPTKDSVRDRLAQAGIEVPEDCLQGVAANLDVLVDHVSTLRAFSLNPRSASAMTFTA